MPYEVCYRALLSISVVEGLKPHTRDAPPARRRAAASLALQPLLPRPALAGLDHNVSVFRFHPQDSLAGGPPSGAERRPPARRPCVLKGARKALFGAGRGGDVIQRYSNRPFDAESST